MRERAALYGEIPILVFAGDGNGDATATSIDREEVMRQSRSDVIQRESGLNHLFRPRSVYGAMKPFPLSFDFEELVFEPLREGVPRPSTKEEYVDAHDHQDLGLYAVYLADRFTAGSVVLTVPLRHGDDTSEVTKMSGEQLCGLRLADLGATSADAEGLLSKNVLTERESHLLHVATPQDNPLSSWIRWMRHPASKVSAAPGGGTGIRASAFCDAEPGFRTMYRK